MENRPNCISKIRISCIWNENAIFKMLKLRIYGKQGLIAKGALLFEK